MAIRSRSLMDLSTGHGCSLCSTVPLRPKVLSCSHAFCEDCLPRFFHSENTPALQVLCPICGKNARLVVVGESFPTSTTKLTRKPPKKMPKAKPPMRTTDLPKKPFSSGKVPMEQNGTASLHFASPESGGIWFLENIHTLEPPGWECWCMNPTEEGGMAVGYLDGGLRIFHVNESWKTVLKDIPVQGFATLSDGGYVVRDAENKINILHPDPGPWQDNPDKRIARVSFNLKSDNGGFGGLGVDSFDNIYIGRWMEGRIDVLRPQGGDVIRKIPCHGYEPWDICPMRGSSMLVVSGGSFVGIIDETGRIKHEIVESHFGEDAHIAVLHDDRVLIGWLCDGVMNIDLYTAQLKHERSVLEGFPVNSSSSNKCCLREFASGEIALSEFERFTVFRKIFPHISEV